MILKSIKLKNFRAYEDIYLKLDDNLNVLVGKNDVGKSTILDALDIFLEGGGINIEPSDLLIGAGIKKITIACEFEIDIHKEYLLDENVKTSLEEESLLNEAGFLEIQKVWDCSKSSITQKSLSLYINALYFSDYSDKPLINEKISELKSILTSKNLICDDKRISKNIRSAIYKTLDESSKSNCLIQLDKEDGKKIWDTLRKELPLFFLFQVDRANKDSDKEFQDPLKAITKTAISHELSQLDEIVSRVKQKANEMAELTISKLSEMDDGVAKSLHANIKTRAWDSLFSFSFDTDDGVPINKRGSGVRRLIMLSYFRAEAERKVTDTRNIIYAIEEPETSQHPNHQTMLIKALKEIGNKDNTQVIITTHTPEIAKLCYEKNLNLICKDYNNKRYIYS